MVAAHEINCLYEYGIFIFFASSEKQPHWSWEGLYVQGIELVRKHIKEEIEASVLRSASSVQGNHLATLSVEEISSLLEKVAIKTIPPEYSQSGFIQDTPDSQDGREAMPCMPY